MGTHNHMEKIYFFQGRSQILIKWNLILYQTSGLCQITFQTIVVSTNRLEGAAKNAFWIKVLSRQLTVKYLCK